MNIKMGDDFNCHICDKPSKVENDVCNCYELHPVCGDCYELVVALASLIIDGRTPKLEKAVDMAATIVQLHREGKLTNHHAQEHSRPN